MILDCRGFPTVQVDVWAGGVLGRADVPAGRSTGRSEAFELRDGDEARYRGFGVQRGDRATSVRSSPRPSTGLDVTEQAELDRALCELDGTADKSRLGANAIVGVSLAAARCGAALRGPAAAPLPATRLARPARPAGEPHRRRPADLQRPRLPGVHHDAGRARRPSARRCAWRARPTWRCRRSSCRATASSPRNTGDEGDFATPDRRRARGARGRARGRGGGGLRRATSSTRLDCAATHLWDAEEADLRGRAGASTRPRA